MIANPNSHVFWDGTHPTAAGHAILGQDGLAVLGFDATIPEPSTAVLLLVTVFMSIGARIRQRTA